MKKVTELYEKSFPQTCSLHMKHTHSQVGPWVISLVPNHSSHKQDTTTEGSLCSKWPPAELKRLDRHHSLSFHLGAWRTERGHKESIQLDPERNQAALRRRMHCTQEALWWCYVHAKQLQTSCTMLNVETGFFCFFQRQVNSEHHVQMMMSTPQSGYSKIFFQNTNKQCWDWEVKRLTVKERNKLNSEWSCFVLLSAPLNCTQLLPVEKNAVQVSYRDVQYVMLCSILSPC